MWILVIPQSSVSWRAHNRWTVTNIQENYATYTLFGRLTVCVALVVLQTTEYDTNDFHLNFSTRINLKLRVANLSYCPHDDTILRMARGIRSPNLYFYQKILFWRSQKKFTKLHPDVMIIHWRKQWQSYIRIYAQSSVANDTYFIPDTCIIYFDPFLYDNGGVKNPGVRAIGWLLYVNAKRINTQSIISFPPDLPLQRMLPVNSYIDVTEKCLERYYTKSSWIYI